MNIVASTLQAIVFNIGAFWGTLKELIEYVPVCGGTLALLLAVGILFLIVGR